MNSDSAIYPLTLVRYCRVHKSLPMDLRLGINAYNLRCDRPILGDDNLLWVGAYSDSYGHFLIDGRIYSLHPKRRRGMTMSDNRYDIVACPFDVDNVSRPPSGAPTLSNLCFYWTDDAVYNTGLDRFDNPGCRICVIPV